MNDADVSELPAGIVSVVGLSVPVTELRVSEMLRLDACVNGFR